MSKVYFTPVTEAMSEKEIAGAARALLEKFVKLENISLKKEIPLKTHFGERGNKTFLRQGNYLGIIDFLKERSIETFFIETSVLYGGERYNKEKHLKLAADHGFDALPIVIADGEKGEASDAVPVNGKIFSNALLGHAFSAYSQIIVLSHFKGHMLAGFGGAIKQLSMGFASKTGKLAMHMDVRPRIIDRKCRRCGACVKRCHENAITIADEHSFIDKSKCVGCGACYTTCPAKAVSVFSWRSLWNSIFNRGIFRKKLAEYALASHSPRRNIYINFALNVTKGCDCEPRPMGKCVKDIGIYISSDPVSIDSACWDAVAAHGTKFRFRDQLDYAKKLGLGSCAYELVE